MTTTDKNSLFLVGATLIKGNDEAPTLDSAIKIQGEVIAEISSTSAMKIPAGAKTIDLSGTFILPGLMDMHAHRIIEMPILGKMMLAHGVTTVRNVETSLKRLSQIQEYPRLRKELLPRIYSTGPFIDSPPSENELKVGYITPPIMIDSPNAVPLEVKRMVEAGANMIEFHFNTKEEIMRAIIKEARRLNIPVAADLLFSRNIFASKAIEAGVKGLDHASGIAQMFCTDLSTVEFFKEWENTDMKSVRRFASFLAQRGSFVIPTLVWFEKQSELSTQFADNLPFFELLPKKIKKRWKNPRPLFGVEKWMNGAKNSLEKIKDFTASLAKSGGKVVTGTDTPNYFVFPGASLHRELELLVESGLTPLRSIQAATRNSADFLGINCVGTLEEGKMADLIVVEGDPLKEIGNIRNIKMVVKDGKVYDPTWLLSSAKKGLLKKMFEKFPDFITDRFDFI